jgi:hypothetical protein
MKEQVISQRVIMKNCLNIFFILFMSYGVSFSQQSTPSKYYLLKTYYSPDTCNTFREYWIDRTGQNVKSFLLNSKDSLLSFHAYKLNEKQLTALLFSPYTASFKYYNKNGITYHHFDLKHRLVCEEKVMINKNNKLKYIVKRDSTKLKYYKETHTKNRLIIKSWFFRTRLHSVSKSVRVLGEKHLGEKKLQGIQRSWHFDGQLKVDLLCEKGYVLEYSFHNLNGELVESKQFSIEDEMEIHDVIKLEFYKKFMKPDERDNKICD